MKKGIALGDLPAIAIALVLAGLVLSLGTITTENMSKGMTCTSITNNESITFADLTNETFTVTGVRPVEEFSTCGGLSSVNNIMNSTYGKGLVITGNFTYNASHITLADLTKVAAGAYYVDYTWRVYTNAQYASRNASTGLAQVASWMPTIGLVVGGAIILGLAFMMLGRREME